MTLRFSWLMPSPQRRRLFTAKTGDKPPSSREASNAREQSGGLEARKHCYEAVPRFFGILLVSPHDRETKNGQIIWKYSSLYRSNAPSNCAPQLLLRSVFRVTAQCNCILSLMKRQDKNGSAQLPTVKTLMNRMSSSVVNSLTRLR